MRKSSRLMVVCVICCGLLLAACGGGAATESGVTENTVADSGGDTTVRVKENADLGSAPSLVPEIAEDGPAPRGQGGPNADAAGVCLNQQEAELARLVNEYRVANNLPALQVSKSLSLVAQQHVWDSNNNQASWPTAPAGQSCNLHSWTRAVNPALQQGTWSEVCYTGDHANAAGMWNKPGEIAGFPGQGVENSFATGGTASASGALSAWKNSPGHNDTILQRSFWPAWTSMGVGLSGGYSHLWFSQTADPAGEAQLCAGVTLPEPTVPATAVPPTVEPTAVPPTATPPPTDVPPTATTEPTAVPATAEATTAAATAEPTAVPATAEATTAAATAEPTAVPPTAEPTAVPSTEVPPTAVPPTDVPPTAAAPTGEVLNAAGTVAAGQTTEHTFAIFPGRSYSIVVSPSAEFDAAPAFTCTSPSGSSFSANFDWRWEGEAETYAFEAIGSGEGTCRLMISGYQGSVGDYTVTVTAR